MKLSKIILSTAIVATSLFSSPAMAASESSVFDRVSKIVDTIQTRAVVAINNKAVRAAVYAELDALKPQIVTLKTEVTGSKLGVAEKAELSFLLDQSEEAIEGLNQIAPK